MIVYISVTHQEYKTAITHHVPVYALLWKAVKAGYDTWKANQGVPGLKLPQVESENVFRFIEEVYRHHTPVEEVDSVEEMEDWLRKQWGGYFAKLIKQDREAKGAPSRSKPPAFAPAVPRMRTPEQEAETRKRMLMQDFVRARCGSRKEPEEIVKEGVAEFGVSAEE